MNFFGKKFYLHIEKLDLFQATCSIIEEVNRTEPSLQQEFLASLIINKEE
jgi:hypothetical protein